MADKWAQLAAQSAPAEGASAPSPADDAWATQPAAPQGTLQRVFGKNPISDTVSNVGTHLANMVSGPYHAFTDAPRSQEEQATVDSHGGMKNPVMNVLNHVGLGAERMLVDPTRDALQQSSRLRSQGGPQSSLWAPSTYDSQGNNVPTAGSSLVDAIPMYGPMSRNYANEVHQQGLVPASAGLATDMIAPKIMGKAIGAGMRGVGLAGEVASATPESLKVAGTRALTPGQSAADLFTRSAKPTSVYGDFGDDISTVAPKLAAQAPKYGGLNGIAKTLNDIKGQSNDWYQKTIDPYRRFDVDASPITKAQMDSIPVTDSIEKPSGSVPLRLGPMTGTPRSGIAVKTANLAKGFDRELPLDTVNDVRTDTNAKMQGIWNKSGGDRYAALSEPENARQFATNNASRDVTYGGINRLSAAGRTDGGIPVSDIQANQKMYGAANKLDDVFSKRGVVFGRQNPMSLPETLAAGKLANPLHAAVDWAGTHVLKGMTDSDALSNAGLDRLNNPDEITLNPRSGILPRAMTSAGNAAGSAGRAIARMPLRNNPFFYSASAFRPSKEKE